MQSHNRTFYPRFPPRAPTKDYRLNDLQHILTGSTNAHSYAYSRLVTGALADAQFLERHSLCLPHANEEPRLRHHRHRYARAWHGRQYDHLYRRQWPYPSSSIGPPPRADYRPRPAASRDGWASGLFLPRLP